jgi:hypothetical protein
MCANGQDGFTEGLPVRHDQGGHRAAYSHLLANSTETLRIITPLLMVHEKALVEGERAIAPR